MAFYFIWATKWCTVRRTHFPAGKLPGALRPGVDCGLCLCLCHCYSPWAEGTGGLSPSVALDCAVPGAPQRQFEDLPNFSLCIGA